jgi:NADH dehydrogenase
VNRYLPIGGPRPTSILETVEVFERLLGHGIPHRGVKPGDPVPGFPPYIAEMLAMLDAYDSPIEMDATALEFGVRLTPVETWAAELVPVGVA